MLVYLQMIETQEDKEKFEILYEEYRGLMYYIAYQILKNNQDAEDAVHNAFVTIAENMKNISEPVCPKTKSYIVTIIESRAIDLYRYKKRHPEVPLDEETVGVQTDYTGKDGLAKCIGQLPTRYRHVLVLKYQLGLDNRGVAKALKITEANAIKLDQRAKARLRELCKEEEIL